MRRRYGIILLDQCEVIFHAYEAEGHHWNRIALQRLPYLNPTQTEIMEQLAILFSNDTAQHIAEWRICNRAASKILANQIASTIGIAIETLPPHREQELLCKGIFSELW